LPIFSLLATFCFWQHGSLNLDSYSTLGSLGSAGSQLWPKTEAMPHFFMFSSSFSCGHPNKQQVIETLIFF
jgi:hypothetical protein